MAELNVVIRSEDELPRKKRFWWMVLLAVLCAGIGCTKLASTRTAEVSSTPTLVTSLSSIPTPTGVSVSIPDLSLSAFEDTTIYYSDLQGGIGKIKGDGSDRQVLFVAPNSAEEWYAEIGDIALSHSGREIAFIQSFYRKGYPGGANSLWIMDTDGGNKRELVGQSETHPGSPTWSDDKLTAFLTKERPMSPIWSPDATLVAFVDSFGMPYEPGKVCILDVESARWWTIGEGDILDWAPDSRSLAVYNSSRYAAVKGIQILNLDGTTKSVIELPSSEFLLSLDWSANTGLIAVQGGNEERSGVYSIFLINPDDGSREMITENDSSIDWLQWSPNGKMISFERMVKDTRNLYVIEIGSKNIQLVMENIVWGHVWSTDSQFLLIHSKVEGDSLYIVSVSDGRYSKIPNTEGTSSQAWWFAAMSLCK